MPGDQHGGGPAGPPVAGDPASFPSDADLARTLAASADQATLSTLTADGYPYGSAVPYALDPRGSSVLLVSEMAEHTANARRDSRASVLVSPPAPGGVDPLGTARMTLIGRLDPVAPGDAGAEPALAAYLAAHPSATAYAGFADFGLWRLEVERCRFIGGFGHMSWVAGADYRAARPTRSPVGRRPPSSPT